MKAHVQPGDDLVHLALDGEPIGSLADVLALPDEQLSPEEATQIRALAIGTSLTIFVAGAAALVFTRLPRAPMTAQQRAEQQHIVDVGIVAVELQTVARESFDFLKAADPDVEAGTVTYDARAIAAIVERLGIALRKADEIGGAR